MLVLFVSLQRYDIFFFLQNNFLFFAQQNYIEHQNILAE